MDEEEEPEELRDSQVSSGWLGKFYAAYGGDDPRCKLPDPGVDGESVSSDCEEGGPGSDGDEEGGPGSDGVEEGGLPKKEILDVIRASLHSNGLFGEQLAYCH